MSTLRTERIRELYGMAVHWDSDEKHAAIRESNLAEFDAWLAEHDENVRAAARGPRPGDEVRFTDESAERYALDEGTVGWLSKTLPDDEVRVELEDGTEVHAYLQDLELA